MENTPQKKQFKPYNKFKKPFNPDGQKSTQNPENKTHNNANTNPEKKLQSEQNHKNKKYYNPKNRYHSNTHHKEQTPYKNPKPIEPLVVFAHCKICSAGISNEAYAIKMGDENYMHFECLLKKVKEIGQQNFSYGNKLRYTYIGSNTFAIYLEQGGSPYIWKILQKVKVEEILTPILKNQQETN